MLFHRQVLLLLIFTYGWNTFHSAERKKLKVSVKFDGLVKELELIAQEIEESSGAVPARLTDLIADLSAQNSIRIFS